MRSRAGHAGRAHRAAAPATETEIAVTPRTLTEAEEAKGLGAVGFSYEPDRFVEIPPSVGNPAEAAWDGFTSAGDLADQIPGGLASAVAGLLGLAPDAGTAVGPIGIASETGRVAARPRSPASSSSSESCRSTWPSSTSFPSRRSTAGGSRWSAVEAVRRRRLPAEREALVYLTGFMVLIVLVILISIRDVANLIGG